MRTLRARSLGHSMSIADLTQTPSGFYGGTDVPDSMRGDHYREDDRTPCHGVNLNGKPCRQLRRLCPWHKR